jgi:hypothetical protein
MLTPEGEIQSPKAVGVGREKDSLPTKLENYLEAATIAVDCE